MAASSSLSCFPVFVLAVLVRLFFVYSQAKSWFEERIELTTPLTSWKRVEEGLALLSYGISPYTGDVVHEVPLVLLLFHGVKQISTQLLPLVFIVLDVVIGLLLYKLAQLHIKSELSDQKARKASFADNVSPVLLSDEALNDVPFLTTALYLLSPYTIGSCVAQSTIIFTNVGVVFALYAALKGNAALATMGVAIAAYHSLYPIMLLAPVVLLMTKSEHAVTKGSINTVLLFVLWFGGLMALSYLLFNSMDFVQAKYGCILSVPDLTPNIGLFWYFFTEMFEHFRVFFLWVFQLNAFFYCLPLTIKLRHHPSFLACILVSVIAVMKSYPSFGDAALSMPLLVLWKHTFPYMRNSFLITCLLLFSTCLAPVFWYLWIYAGSANANFFFAITLVYSTAQILLSSDVLFAFLRREYDLVNGIYPKIIDGEPVTVLFK